MSFLEIALAHAALGLYVFPVAKDKSTLTAHGFKDGSIDPERIRAWWTKFPSSNPGFAPGVSGVAVLDIDHGLTDMASFLAWCSRNGIPATYTVRSGSRPEFKVHMYFRGAIPDVGIWELDGCSGQVKSLGGYVLAAGSEALHGANHDKPGAPYEAICGTLGVFTALPDVIRQLRKPMPEVTSSSKVPKTAWRLPVHEAENRTGFLLEQTGAMRNLGCGKDAILARMVELNDDPEIIADPVDAERLESTAANCAKFPVPAPVPVVRIGSASTSQPEAAPLAEATPRPVYPDDAWTDTLYGEFADIVCRDNFIPRKFPVESFRVLTGALVGNQVTCGMAGVRMREYLVAIGHPQSGKSYGKDLAVMFYTQQSLSFTFEPLLFHGGGNPYRAQGIGAQQFLPGSPNSFADDLNRKPKNSKTPKGESAIVIDIDPGEKWTPYARLITIQGEAMSMLARFSNEWVGQALSALVTDLYDGDEAEVAVTSERGSTKQAVRLQYSMMLYTQPGTWRKYMAETVTDSGLFGRFYLVGSEQRPTQVPLGDYQQNPGLFQQHFGDLRRDVFNRIHALANTEMVMQVAPEAKKKITEWLSAIPTAVDHVDRVSRMGLHVYRCAMARAWGAKKQRTVISAEDADAAILLGQYQIRMREFYAPITGDDRRAKALNLVRHTIRTMGQITLNELRRQVHAERFSEQFEWALKWLESHHEIAMYKKGRTVIVSWVAGRESAGGIY